MNNRVWIVVLVLVLVIGSAIGSVALLGRGGRGGSGFLGAGGAAGGNQIGIVYITGVISAGGSGGDVFGGAIAGSDDLMAQLRDAKDDPAIKAVVLRVNSPGGSAAASQEIAGEIQKLRQEGKKVVVSMADVAASGAYWVAAQSDYIMANAATETGSIGVIMDLLNYEELYKKLGLRSVTIKSAAHKDIGSPTRPMTPEEETILQAMVDDIFNQFVQVVAQGRHLPEDQVRQLADGRVFTGRQAKDLGLVDGLGNFEDAVKKAAELAGIEHDYSTVDMQPISPLEQLLQGLGLRDGLPSLLGGVARLRNTPFGLDTVLLQNLLEGGAAGK
ncbi:MAG: signal peptide peptidase SppA [Bacillota bacterium]